MRGSLKLVLVIAALFGSVTTSSAQIGIQDFIGNRGLRLSGGVDLNLTRFGDNAILVSATAFAAVRNVQSVLDAGRPAINRYVACDTPRAAKLGGSVELEQVSITGSSVSGNGVVLGGVATLRNCGLISAQVNFAIPLTATVQNGGVRVVAGPLTLEATGWGQSIVVAAVRQKLTPQINPLVKQLNDQIASQLGDQSLRRYVAKYRLAITSVALASESSDFVLRVGLAGQTTPAEINAIFAGRGGDT